MKYESSFKDKLIYVFRINDKEHKDCLKIGEATIPDEVFRAEPNSSELNKAAKIRINSYTQTAGISYELLYTESTVYKQNGHIKSFTDHEVRNILSRSGFDKKVFNINGKANEWFVVDLETVKNAIKAVKEGRDSLKSNEKSSDKNPVIFRPEQLEAIEKTKKVFKKSNTMLWFAKMRFGKTLTALQVTKEHNFKRTLILTHRPVVNASWFEDFDKIFYDNSNYNFGSKTSGSTYESLEKNARTKPEFNYVYFASMQDLRGSSQAGGNFDKNNELFDTNWDFLIIDEAHEGTQTELGKNVIQLLTKVHTKTLHLSGTPFNLIDNYQEDEIYTWDYVMEQRAKSTWDEVHFGDPNPYSSLPKLNIYTFDLNKELKGFIDEDVAFNFKEFFRVTKEGDFKYEKDILSFLNLICKNNQESNYPFSTKEYQDNFRHSLWMVPGVKEAKALSNLLQSHPVFSQFKIVNVAGEGDEEESKDEALTKVENAITKNPENTYTITLSCGRLTTGVSVPAWTAVFMLSGSYNTSASTYMQTIFRVQTPAKINGKDKVECYVFDFAPDRTLKVVAEVAKISSKAGKTTLQDREVMGEFLNFCPIISISGSNMSTYNVEGMLEQLKKVYVERVVRNGFEDGYLYDNDQLMKLDKIELKEFENLKKIIGSTKAIPKSADIDINSQGFTNEEFDQSEEAKKKEKTKRELTEEEKRLLKEREEKKKIRDSAISILRGISIRMPLLIYGADLKDEDQELNIDNFSNIVDDHSWEEFMPKGVTKKVFEEFKKYYEPDIFRAAGKRIRAIARAADNLGIEERISRITSIFSTFRNPDKETVLTPWRVVNMHLGDSLGGYVFFDENYELLINYQRFLNIENVTDSVFNEDARILEINSKSGLYPLFMGYGIYRRLLDNLFSKSHISPSIEDQQNLWDKVMADNIFVICKTPMAKSITKRTLVGFRDAKVNTRYFEDLVNQITNKQQNFLDKIKQGKTYWKSNTSDNMKFNAVVGNPPYQETLENTSDKPIYNYFMDIAFKISDKVTFITPARFLFNAGKTPKEWNQKILNDDHFKVVWYKNKSTDVFPNVDIKGGVAVTFRDANQNFGRIISFTSHIELNSINEKISNSIDFQSITEIISLQNKFNLQILYHDYPHFKSIIGSNGKEKRLTSPIFDQLNIFKDKKVDVSDIKIYGLVKNKRINKWINAKYLDKHANIDNYKVLVPKANGSGEFGETLSTPFIAEPHTGFTFSYISFGSFKKKEEAEAVLKYVKSKFTRTLLGILKVTQDNLPNTWSKIPLQDFSEKSDIKWDKPIQEIDKQLYAKYNLSNDEINFIESMIKPMS
jgi:superfamily II DNA or RNA helicase